MIEFTPLTHNNHSQFADLFQREKGQLRAHQQRENINWSFLQQPFAQPNEAVVELAVENGQLLGCMGVVPQLFLDGSKEIRGAFFIDWLVDSRQRRRNIGSQLIKRATARFPVSVHLGSTPSGYATCATLGAQDCGRTMTARRILHPWNWSKGTANPHLAKRLAWSLRQLIRLGQMPALPSPHVHCRLVTPNEIDTQLITFSQRLAQTHFCTLRNAARWNWLLTSPLYRGWAYEITHQKRIIGYAALVLAQRSQRLVGTVADLCVATIEDAPTVLAAAINQLAQLHPDGIVFTISEEVALPLIAQMGFELQSNPMMGCWLHTTYESLLSRRWWMTGAENLSVSAGIDWVAKHL